MELNKNSQKAVRGAPMTALAVQRLTGSAFVGGAPGLQLSVNASGVRSWRVFYRLPGSAQRRAMSLGRFPGVPLSSARKLAGEALALAANGIDPKTARAKRAARSVVTVSDALDVYGRHCDQENEPRTVRAKSNAFKNHVRPFVGGCALGSVSRRDWLALITRLDGRPGMRRNLYLYLRHFLGWAVERDYIDANPVAGVRPPRPVANRDRVLSDDELRSLWRVEGDMADMARLAVLTAQRQGSIASMRWDEIDLGRGVWSIPPAAMKSGAAHEAPLGELAIGILSRRPRFQGPYVFGAGSNGHRPFNAISRGMRTIRRALADIPDRRGQRIATAEREEYAQKIEEGRARRWRFHDLRRTAVTLAQRAGAPLDAVRALTQHKTSGVIGIYARHSYSHEKRDVAAGLNATVRGILGVPEVAFVAA